MNKIGLRKLNNVSQKYKELLLKDIEDKKILLEDVTTCVCCGEKNFEKLLDVDRFDLPFGSYLCKACGLISTSPRIKQESLPYYYETYYHPLNYGKEDLSDQEALFKVGQGRKIFTKLKPYLNHKKDITILEIGAGVGNVLDEFRKEAAKEAIAVEPLGTEYSPECIAQCERRNIHVIEGNAASVLQKNKTFDLIILSHVFEHFIDLKEELNTLKRLLKNDGLLYIEVPGILKIHNKPYYNFSFIGYSVHAHMYNFSSITLKNIVEQYGFSLLKCNEEVESIFRVEKNPNTLIENDYIRIKYYLDFLEEFSSYIKTQQKTHQKEIEKYKTMIENRNKDIEKYKTMVENRNKDIEKYKTMVENRNKDIEKYKTMVENRNKDIEKQKIHTEKLNTVKNSKQLFSGLNALIHPIKKYKQYKQLMRDIDAI